MSIEMTQPATNGQQPITVNPTDFIMSYDLSAVRASLIRKEILSSEEADKAIAEYRKFMLLISRGYGRMEMFSRKVDEVWHAHILFTVDYADFCEKALGYFLHHTPNDPDHPRLDTSGAQRFIALYEQEFNTPVPSIWNGVYGDFGRGCCGACDSAPNV